MKKVEMVNDELRPEYSREDFGAMVRGKYAARLKESSNIVVLDPEIAEAFPNTKAVNDALRGLLELARVGTRLPAPSSSTTAPALHSLHKRPDARRWSTAFCRRGQRVSSCELGAWRGLTLIPADGPRCPS